MRSEQQTEILQLARKNRVGPGELLKIAREASGDATIPAVDKLTAEQAKATIHLLESLVPA